MRAAVQSVVVEFRMLASPLEIRSSPQAMATHGIRALVTAMIANGTSRFLQPGLKRGRPIARTITTSARQPEAERTSRSTVGAMSCPPTLIRKKDTPQIRARPARICQARAGEGAVYSFRPVFVRDL